MDAGKRMYGDSKSYGGTTMHLVTRRLAGAWMVDGTRLAYRTRLADGTSMVDGAELADGTRLIDITRLLQNNKRKTL